METGGVVYKLLPENRPHCSFPVLFEFEWLTLAGAPSARYTNRCQSGMDTGRTGPGLRFSAARKNASELFFTHPGGAQVFFSFICYLEITQAGNKLAVRGAGGRRVAKAQPAELV